jgi:Fic family protein
MQDYTWEKTPKILQLLNEIEVLRKVFAIVPVVPAVEENLLRHSLLKSAVYSAKVEGIPSTESEPRLEAQNLLVSYQRIFSGQLNGEFNVDLVKQLHAQVMRNLSGYAGVFRTEPWAIYNEAGMAVHLAPLHTKLPELMASYVAYITGLKDHPCEIAAVSQFVLEKIHPFADGNGRVGRLVSAYWLTKLDSQFKGLLMLEEYIEKHKSWYYQALIPSHNMTDFVEFFLEAMVAQANAALERLKQAGFSVEQTSNLLPRREEIVALIRDHPRCTFDFIQRRFASVNPKSLHYDLAWLLKHKLIKKLGVTRGVLYEAI